MDTVGDLVAAASEREGLAFDAPSRSTGHSYDEFSTNAWKAGNLLRHYAVRAGATVAVSVGPKEPAGDSEPGRLVDAVEPLLAALGTCLLGGTVSFDPTASDETVALVAPSAWLDRFEVGPGCSRLAYGGLPSDPSVAHFERELWSENPVQPPESVDPDAGAVARGPTAYTQRELLQAAASIVDETGLESGDRVAIRTEMDAGTIVAGVLAPLRAGATIVGGGSADADVVVGPDGTVDPATILP